MVDHRRASRGRLATLVLAVACATLPLAGAAAAIEQPLVVLPCAPSSRGALVLLGKRVLVENPDGALPDDTQPSVPAWAGQWTPVAGSPEVTTASTITLALRLFAAQTGQAITGASAAIVQADNSDFDVVKVVIVPTTEAALAHLAAAAGDAVNTGSPLQDVFSEVDVTSVADALVRLGPVPPPAGGWAPWVLENVYGSVRPNALDTTYPLLVNLLATRSAQPATQFQQALLGVAATACGVAPAPTPRP